MQLYPFQQTSVSQAIAQDSFAFFAQMGCGKSCMAINSVLQKFGHFPKTIIFSPKVTLSNWKREMKMWAPDEFPVVVEETTAARRIEVIKRNHIIIINYEAVRSAAVAAALKEFKADVVIADESTRIKNSKALQTKAVIDISKSAKFKLALTGTPAVNGYADLFSQFLFLDGGKTFGKSFFSFRAKYFYNKNAGWNSTKAFPDWHVREDMVPELLKLVGEKSYSIKTKDAVDLPDLVEQEIPVQLKGEQLKHYLEIKNDLITFLRNNPDDVMVVQNALTKLVRLNEIMSGYMKLEDGRFHDFDENAKIDALEELIEMSYPHKMIVFACFKRNYDMITKMLDKNKVKYVLLDDDISDKIDVFNDLSNDVRVCIGNPKSSGIGVNMKSAKYATFYSRSFSLEEYLQAKARNVRAGSIDIHDKVVHFNLVASDTVDEKIMAALNQKQSILSSIYQIKSLLD